MAEDEDFKRIYTACYAIQDTINELENLHQFYYAKAGPGIESIVERLNNLRIIAESLYNKLS